MTTIHDHLKRYPNARSSTLAYIAKRDETTKRLQREINARLPIWKRIARAIVGRV
ncbi:conserved hypothetical protein [Agrobacterium genomosp. 5 str. CFBP 6626]|nr:conserved hypothetical protein [Agrobacterium genomosp. 5 str. CFBP 6626]